MKILLVEDNQDHEILTLRALKKNGIDAAVIVARDGTEAIDCLFARGDDCNPGELPDIILLDLKLPKLDGLSVLKVLRSEGPTRFVPVIVLSSSSEEEDVKDAYRLGANSYIRKPVDFDEFVAAVGEIAIYWGQLNHAVPPAELPFGIQIDSIAPKS